MGSALVHQLRRSTNLMGSHCPFQPGKAPGLLRICVLGRYAEIRSPVMERLVALDRGAGTWPWTPSGLGPGPIGQNLVNHASESQRGYAYWWAARLKSTEITVPVSPVSCQMWDQDLVPDETRETGRQAPGCSCARRAEPPISSLGDRCSWAMPVPWPLAALADAGLGDGVDLDSGAPAGLERCWRNRWLLL